VQVKFLRGLSATINSVKQPQYLPLMGFGCDCLRRDIFAFERSVVAITGSIFHFSPSCTCSIALRLATGDARCRSRSRTVRSSGNSADAVGLL